MGQRALMFGTASGNTPGDYFAALGQKIFQRSGIFIADHQAGIRTKTTDFTSVIYPFFSSGSPISIFSWVRPHII